MTAHGEATDRPCRYACRHYDCLMDRGEPLPPGVVGYQHGARYHDAATRAKARAEAIRIVDGRHGYSIEYASDSAAHAQEWDAEEARLLAEIAQASDRADAEAAERADAETAERQKGGAPCE